MKWSVQWLCVENIGTGLAYDIHFKKIDPASLKRYSPENPMTLGDVGFLRDGIIVDFRIN